jgi:hypothetical protein
MGDMETIATSTVSGSEKKTAEIYHRANLVGKSGPSDKMGQNHGL